ncbi:MAG: RNA-directed DNA polymerase [Clostridia bacterium]|uniref:reverse transcriptase family protein n=1 Tax=Dubosiella newyorkensis TaxID=1862672 RepID=UPI0025ABB73F|nr:reverse transcriptase family protein [Dubosiella newyorkensis]MCI9407019.1 RNA-directed DNA polymerase [Clostridia bacterium]
MEAIGSNQYVNLNLSIIDSVSDNSYVSYFMTTNDTIDNAFEKNLISAETASLLKEYNERLRQNNVPIIYNLRHLRKIFNIKKKDQNKYFGSKRNEYYHFTIPKKSGGVRDIEAPSDTLKSFQTWIKNNILEKMKISENAKGFKRSCSILDNAREHVGKELVINIDLKDFFPSITYKKVFSLFYYLGYTKEVCHLLTQICTNKANVLPQGSPASPIISNIITLKLDKRLNNLAAKYNCTYTRYADDMTFSGNKNIRIILPVIQEIITDEGFTINLDKLRLQYKFQRQEVTGLIVNTKVSIPHSLTNEIKNAIYFCKKLGVEIHMKNIDCSRSFYKEHLYGIAYFIKMIDAEKGKHYLHQLNEIEWPY